MTQKLRFGATSNSFINTGSYGSPVWVYLLTVADAEFNVDWDEADASTRGQQPVAATEPTQMKLQLEFDMVGDIGNTAFLALRAAALAKTVCDMITTTGESATTTGEVGVRADFKVFSMKENGKLNGVEIFHFVMKPCYSDNEAIFDGDIDE